MDKPSGYTIFVTLFVFFAFVILLAISRVLNGFMFFNVDALAAILAIWTGLLSAAMWIRSANLPEDSHANRMAAISTASSILATAVGTFKQIAGAEEQLIMLTQWVAFSISVFLLLWVFGSTVRGLPDWSRRNRRVSS